MAIIIHMTSMVVQIHIDVIGVTMENTDKNDKSDVLHNDNGNGNHKMYDIALAMLHIMLSYLRHQPSTSETN